MNKHTHIYGGRQIKMFGQHNEGNDLRQSSLNVEKGEEKIPRSTDNKLVCLG